MKILNSSSSDGFSLIELLVAIAVVGILAALALPAYRSWMDNTEYKEAARRLTSILRQGRSVAVARNRECRVTFDFAADQYTLALGDRPYSSSSFSEVLVGNTGLPQGVDLRGDNDADVDDDDDCSVTTGTAIIKFNPNGSANTRYVCVMDDAGNRQYRVGVPAANTGRSVIQRWNAGASDWE